MTKVLILYYSAYGHMERMAQAVAEGVRDAGVEADIKRVPELVPEEMAKQSGFKLDQKAPIATIAELAGYDAIIFDTAGRLQIDEELMDELGRLRAATLPHHILLVADAMTTSSRPRASMWTALTVSPWSAPGTGSSRARPPVAITSLS